MMLLVVGCNFKNTPVEVRERLAFTGPRLAQALDELSARYGCEAVILSTCNRVEIYLARNEALVAPDAELIAEFLLEFHGIRQEEARPEWYHHSGLASVIHLFRVVASLDSLVIGEGQIAGQVKQAYETAQERAAVGPTLHALFQHARIVAKRARTETGISRGHVSVSSLAVDYVRQVFDHFGDKTVLVIGAGKMGELTLRHLKDLQPRQILVANRSPEKAAEVAGGCGGRAVAWDQLDDALAQADIVLSTTGAPEPIVTRRRWNDVLARRSGGTVVILDIAVPRDFDPRIHDGDRTCLFNIDDLKKIREQTLQERGKHVAAAEAIVAQEQRRFLAKWTQRQHVPIIAKLTRDFEARRQIIVQQLFRRLNGKLGDEDRSYIEGAFRLLQNQFLHGPISALAEEAPEENRHTLRDALRKLFRLEE
ncbi:MAG: glutamyl-tRNA reductase [Planctomycetes bacterium]|nr:glutamyl-tRNA reductase [Planctomycetota bacterium]